jgi:hypothetical protein
MIFRDHPHGTEQAPFLVPSFEPERTTPSVGLGQAGQHSLLDKTIPGQGDQHGLAFGDPTSSFEYFRQQPATTSHAQTKFGLDSLGGVQHSQKIDDVFQSQGAQFGNDIGLLYISENIAYWIVLCRSL